MAESSSTRRNSLDKPPRMSSSNDPVTERLLCSICQDVFNDPVSTPCGHNFCKICLNKYWNNSEDYRCPNCKETFKQRLDLKINTTLRDVVDEHKKKSHKKQAEAEVVCDICTEGKLKAVKSCLVCQSSYCETHLESHLRVSGLQKHKLIDPVKNLQDYICQTHDRPLELFCKDDQTSACVICSVTDHKNHNTVPIREEKHHKDLSRQKKASSVSSFKFWFLAVGLVLVVLSACFIQIYKDIQPREAEITELKKRNNELNLDIQRSEAETLERLESSKTQITELKRNNELDLVMQRREAEITELKKKNNELNLDIQRSEAETLERLESSKIEINELKKNNELVLVMQRRDAENTELKKKNNELNLDIQRREAENTELKKKNNELNLDIQRREAETLERLESSKTEITELKKRNSELDLDIQLCKAELKWIQQCAVEAHPDIILFDDEEQVRDGDIMHDLPDNPKRFDTCPNVLGKEGFLSGRFYVFLVVGLVLVLCLFIVLRLHAGRRR